MNKNIVKLHPQINRTKQRITKMNTIIIKNYDHNIDYKFSQGASLSSEKHW